MSVGKSVAAGVSPTVGLKRRMLSAGSWVGIGQMASYALRLGGNLLLTRLLAPEMFGIMAIVAIVGVVLSMLSDVGIGPSIVKSERGRDPDFLNTAWTVQIVRGFFIYTLALLLAAGVYWAGQSGLLPQGSTYAEPQLPALIAVGSLTVVIMGFQSTNYFSVQRELNMKPRALLELVVQVIGLVVMAVLAWRTGSIWSIAVGMIVSSVAHTLLTHWWLPGIRNKLRWERRALKEMITFGTWVLVSSAISVFAMNGDRLILGGLVSAELLGVYSIAFNFSSIVQSVALAIVSMVSLPAFSELARTAPEKIARAFFSLRRVTDGFVVFFAGFVYALAETIITVLYDDRYADAGQILQILSFTALASRFLVVQQVYLALGKSQYLMLMSATQVVSLYTLVPVAFHLGGFETAVVAIALKDLAVVPVILFLNSKHGLLDWRTELITLLPWPVGLLAGLMVKQALALMITL